VFYSSGKNFWDNKKVFITGHTGFKGSWLCLLLNELGAKVTGYSLPPDSKKIIFNQIRIFVTTFSAYKFKNNLTI